MPNIRSAKKRVRVTKAKTLRNKIIKSNVKTTLKISEQAVKEQSENKTEAIRVAIKKVDQAAAKGVFHKNQAARKKAQLQKLLNESNA